MCILEISPEIYKSKFNFLWEQSDITDLLQLVLQLPLGAARGPGRSPLFGRYEAMIECKRKCDAPLKSKLQN